jgi:hypothetical protein
MKPTDPNRRALLDELLLGDETSAAPSLAAVIEVVDREKRRRLRRGRAIVATAFVVGAVAFSSLTLSRNPSGGYAGESSSVPATPADFPARTEEPFKVTRINDEELQAFLAETPSALVQWDDGRRAVILVVNTARDER